MDSISAILIFMIAMGLVFAGVLIAQALSKGFNTIAAALDKRKNETRFDFLERNAVILGMLGDVTVSINGNCLDIHQRVFHNTGTVITEVVARDYANISDINGEHGLSQGTHVYCINTNGQIASITVN